MNIRIKRLLPVFITTAVFLISVFISGGEKAMGAEQRDLTSLKMSYRLQRAYTPYKYLQIEISGDGQVKLEYELYREYVSPNETKKRTLVFKVKEEQIKELFTFYQQADFLNLKINDLNKDKIRVTDVGITTLIYSYKGQERTLFYGYLKDNPLNEIAKFYFQIARKYLSPIQQPRSY